MIDICSKSRILELIYNRGPKNLIVISIHDTDKEPAFDITDSIVSLKIQDSCILAFDDVISDNEYPKAKVISEFDIITILQFATKYKDVIQSKSRLFYIQCDGGVSRSAAVGAALSLIFNNDDWWIFNNPKFCPNRYVYESILKVCNRFDLLNSCNEKFSRNLALFFANTEELL